MNPSGFYVDPQIMHLEKDSVKKRLKRIRMEKMKADSGVTFEELLRRF